MPEINNPFSPSPQWVLAREETKLVRALWGGTAAMRAVASFLPKFPKETGRNWEARRDSTFLFPFYREAIERHGGRIFSEPVRYTKEALALPGFQEFVDDVDGAGTNFNRWLYLAYLLGEHLGVVHSFVDFPSDGGSLKDVQGVKPRLLRWTDQLIGWRHDDVSGRATQLRFIEIVEKDSGKYGSDFVERVRVVEPGSVETFERELAASRARVDRIFDTEGFVGTFGRADTAGASEGIPQTGVVGDFSLELLPFESLYTEQTGPLTGKPSAQRLAELNHEHWILASQVSRGRTYAIRPWYHFAGFSKIEYDAASELGFGMKVRSDNVNSRLEAIEQPVNAVKLGMEELEKIEARAWVLASDPLLSRAAGPETASGRIIDKTEAHSKVQARAIDLEDFANRTLRHWGEWLDVEMPEDIVRVNTDFSNTEAADVATMVEVFEKLVEMPAHLQTVAVEEMKRRDILADQWEAEDFVAAFEEMRDNLVGGAAGDELASVQARLSSGVEMLRSGRSADEAMAAMSGDAGSLSGDG